ncbi:gliding motility-associated lipoprotein GldD [bacterium A37T11]|nr:gliding motility-associated lipoprotein GldD [bacterium A37T11]
MKLNLSLGYLVAILWLIGCRGSHNTPKPQAYHRIIFPEKRFQAYHAPCHFSFNYPSYAGIQLDQRHAQEHPCWFDITFPSFNARLYLSYYTFHTKTELDQLTEDAHSLAFAHTIKATAIDEGQISIPAQSVYGIYYEIGGNAASAIQFYITDSTKNYLRGALYFNERPKLDSVQPVIDFIKTDIDTLIKSFQWK